MNTSGQLLVNFGSVLFGTNKYCSKLASAEHGQFGKIAYLWYLTPQISIRYIMMFANMDVYSYMYIYTFTNAHTYMFSTSGNQNISQYSTRDTVILLDYPDNTTLLEVQMEHEAPHVPEYLVDV